jgi:hypothetical protein
MKNAHDLTVSEGQRQLLLMALAHLAVERPGFDAALSEIAALMDNPTPKGPEMYTRFKALHILELRAAAGDRAARRGLNLVDEALGIEPA